MERYLISVSNDSSLRLPNVLCLFDGGEYVNFLSMLKLCVFSISFTLHPVPEFENIPKKGSIVIFTSDERCLHKVNTIESGTRIVVPIWLTRNIEQIEVI